MLESLRTYGVAGSAPLPVVESLVRVAAELCARPMAALCILEPREVVFLSAHGFSLRATARERSFCAAAVESGGPCFEVNDATTDARFSSSELVSGPLQVRSCAAVPLVDGGHALGALCVFGTKPGLLTPNQHQTLEELGRAVMGHLAAHRQGQQARRELLDTLESAPIGMLSASRDGTIRFANRSTLALFGYSMDELRGRPVSLLVGGGAAHRHDEHVRKFAARPVTRPMGAGSTLRARRKDGTEFPVEVGLTALDSGDVIAAITDLTLRQRIAEHERLVTTGTLAAGVGHEINNPLAWIQSNLDFVVDELSAIIGGSPSARLREVMDAVKESRDGAERIRRIVVGLRTLSREDATLGPRDLNAAIDVSINMAMHEIRPVAKVERDFGSVPHVLADDSRLTQVFVNLLVNAAQAFQSPSPQQNRITVRTRAEGETAMVEIIDNGPGIKADVLPRIFDPFFTTKPVGVGTGLGLSICRTITAAFGGSLDCKSTPGEGTTFVVRLPTSSASPDEEPARPASQPEEPRGRLLIVDDESFVLSSLARLLRNEHDLTLLSDSREARLHLLDPAQKWDMVLCDVMMPHLGGIELFGELRQARPDVARDFVFMTASPPREEVRAFLETVDNACLEKPLNGRTLRALVRRAVTQKRSTAPAAE